MYYSVFNAFFNHPLLQELKETRKKLEELTEKRDDLGKETQKMRDDLVEAQEEIKRSSRELKDLKARVKGSVDEKDSLSGVSSVWSSLLLTSTYVISTGDYMDHRLRFAGIGKFD